MKHVVLFQKLWCSERNCKILLKVVQTWSVDHWKWVGWMAWKKYTHSPAPHKFTLSKLKIKIFYILNLKNPRSINLLFKNKIKVWWNLSKTWRKRVNFFTVLLLHIPFISERFSWSRETMMSKRIQSKKGNLIQILLHHRLGR